MCIEFSRSSFAANQENLMMLRAKLSKVALDEVLSSFCPVFTFFQTEITLQIGESGERALFHFGLHIIVFIYT